MPTYNGRELDSNDYKNKAILEWLYYDENFIMRDVADLFEIALGTVQYWMDKKAVGRTGGSAGYHYARYSVNNGYPRWQTRTADGFESVPVHRLLAVSKFGFDAVADNVIHHKNGIKWDNRPENLKIMDKNTHRSLHWSGERNPNSKLTKTDIKHIRGLYHVEGYTQDEIAEQYEISQSNVSRVLNGNRWESIKG